MRFMIQRTLLAVAAAAAMTVTGCSDAGSPLESGTAPIAPAFARSTTTSTELAAESALDIIAKRRQTPVITIGWAKKWIGPEGGRLEFLGYALDVPAGAVDRITQFTIRVPYPKDPARVVAEFGPHGRKFSRPVTISFPLRGTTIERAPDPTVVWWNDQWVDMGGWISGDGTRLSTYTDHFSEYGTTTQAARGGTLTTSGG
jgi:hypothetical protein